MKLLRLILAIFAVSISAASAFAADDNVVVYWNNQALNAVRLARTPPPIAAHHLAVVHAAIHNSVVGLTGTHRTWQAETPAPAGADQDAAIASAAYTVISTLWGQGANPMVYRTAYEKALADIPAGPSKDAGIAYGKQVAQAAIAARAQSGWNKPIEGVFSSTEQGKWRETPPGFRPPVLPHWANVVPFVMTSPSQFRPGPPPALDSEEHAQEIAYINRVGARDNAERNEYETLSTIFWADDLGSATPPGHWNVIAQDLVRRNKLSVADTARLYALLNLACADAGISCWDTKFFYRGWRPETAIREVTKQANPHAVANPDFIPLMNTPAFPGYTSGHSTFSSAGSRILELWFGTDNIEFTTTSDGLPGAVRSYKKLSDARKEIGMSRIWGGIHFMSDNLVGQQVGIQIADYVFANALQPVAK